jgi:predicted nucleotidyltransferase
MKDKYKSIRTRMSRFNEWETEYLRSLHPTRRLEQFFILFEVAQSCDDQEKSKMHEEHLRGLVETQKRLKRVHRRDKVPIVNKITEYFSAKQEVVAVYLFGSYAQDREKGQSDIDLGILLDRDVLSRQDDLRTLFLTDLGRMLRKDLHIVLMNFAGEEILAQIFKHGKCIFQRNSQALANFKTAKYSLIAEFAYSRAIMEKSFVSRILRGSE